MDDADDITSCGGWSRARLIEMDANFVAAMQRALDVSQRTISEAKTPSNPMDDADDVDINRCGGWSRERLIEMDAGFVAAMQRALDVSQRTISEAKTPSNPMDAPCSTEACSR